MAHAPISDTRVLLDGFGMGVAPVARGPPVVLELGP